MTGEIWDLLNPRRPPMSTTETVFGGGVDTERIQMSAIANLKEFFGRDKLSERMGEQSQISVFA